MEKVIIKASNRVNGKNVPAGEMEVNKPLTVAEAVREFGEDGVLDRFWRSRVIEVQALIRGGGDSKTAQVKRLLAKIEAEPDGELAQLAKRLGFQL